MTTPEESKRLVLDFYQIVMSDGHIHRLNEFVSETYIDHNGSANDQGRDSLIRHISGLRSTFPDFEMACHEAISDGEWFAVRVTGKGTHLGEWMGIRPSNKTVYLKGINFDRVVDGKISEHYGEADTVSMMLQMGVNPFPGG